MEDNKKVKLKNRRNIKRRKEPKTKDNNKSFIKKKLIIFSIIILIITIILNISITKILLNSKCKNTEKYEVIEDVTSSDTASDIQQTINSNKDYVFSCLPSQLEENDLMINKVIFCNFIYL